MRMPRSFYDYKPDPVADRKSVADFLAFRFPELTQRNHCRIENDTEVFYAVNGGIWKGTRIAIHAKGLKIDPFSQDFIPHEWLDETGFVDPERARKYPYPHSVRMLAD